MSYSPCFDYQCTKNFSHFFQKIVLKKVSCHLFKDIDFKKKCWHFEFQNLLMCSAVGWMMLNHFIRESLRKHCTKCKVLWHSFWDFKLLSMSLQHRRAIARKIGQKYKGKLDQKMARELRPDLPSYPSDPLDDVFTTVQSEEAS